MKDLQKSLHNPPTAGYSPERGQMEMCVTTGSQEGLCKIFEMLVNSGDSVLLDAPTQLYEAHFPSSPFFSCDLSLSRSRAIKYLRKLLERWDPADAQKPGSSVPRVLYTIPNGGNPTRASVTCERKQEVYELIVSQLLHSWGPEGFLKHIDGGIEFYRSQRNAMLSSADQWLKGFQETGWSYQGCHASG
ncbi:kynurenine/alpha-aminoadipate aminotransferase, mitochondrial-like [Sinocyclocheilus anshuiensis]|uniref:kynurenine/alpha-aminoadipate aminotransferase, mitochondrial-like n=1 Tax=Sinocyclocheilus anshuiensis TaxID=1608454 RepID=UPI0007B9CE3C|nr:PREDICTED: kynurenine/alpha-aminoadipate aminotransferase, mitochondrial-like [Sinocyclocheilus anshuiensis]XP_016352708.1 PREDICTED: kynurenine/alpha-aminoadipate aminotransferase, mitochondrial-like [Sinocyclocheilus anshuiensis]